MSRSRAGSPASGRKSPSFMAADPAPDGAAPASTCEMRAGPVCCCGAARDRPGGLPQLPRPGRGGGGVAPPRRGGGGRGGGGAPPPREPIAFHHLPLFDGQEARPEGWPPIATLADRYLLLAEIARVPIARLITVLAEAGGPVVYHCAAGKDRTGVVSAVLLGLLGVRDEVIVADYAATQENLEAIIERLMAAKGY